ncbi:magnesium transporter family protein [Rhodotorula toruloides]|uniref:Magnesium transporter family protein n=1 Tax=Rhodotorula toruloides TaxID=5286 RepID=A0A511KQ81_RHOTO|nr:magnesium transporter family protein [Rhodotorula toruloides]
MLARLVILVSSLVLLHSAYSAWQARIAAATGGFEVVLVEAVSSFITLVIGILWSAPALKGVTFASEMRSRSLDSTDSRIAFANVRHRGSVLFGQDSKS